MKLSHTEETGVTLVKFSGYWCNSGHRRLIKYWRHVDQDGRHVGPCYPTKAEALADTIRYVRDSWNYKGIGAMIGGKPA